MPESESFIQRMKLEAGQLAERISKLEAFFDNPIFKQLAELDQDLLKAQFAAMSGYLKILVIRLKRAEENLMV